MIGTDGVSESHPYYKQRKCRDTGAENAAEFPAPVMNFFTLT